MACQLQASLWARRTKQCPQCSSPATSFQLAFLFSFFVIICDAHERAPCLAALMLYATGMIYGMWVLRLATAAQVAAAATLEWDLLRMRFPHIPQDTAMSPLREQTKCKCSTGRMELLGGVLGLVLAQWASRFIRISMVAAATVVTNDPLYFGCLKGR